MNPDDFHAPNGPEMAAYVAAEEAAIEQLLAVAAARRKIDPERAMHIMMVARRRAQGLRDVREWLDLR